MRLIGCTKIHALLGLILLFSAGARGQAEDHALTPNRALERLIAGNARFVAHKEQHPDESPARRKQLAQEQHPFAVILGCADSRVPPELLFDEGLGDLFVIRVAGNVVDDDVLASIEYAVEHLGTKLIVVLGHEKCGAVSVAVSGESAVGHIGSLISAIKPSVLATAHSPGDQVHNCVVENALHAARQIRASDPILKPAIEGERLKVVAADYELDTGRVRLLEGQP